MKTIQLPENAGAFLEHCICQHEQLQAEIAQCRDQQTDILARLQCQFNHAVRYAKRIVEEAKTAIFPGPDMEILFFKQIKPLFSAEAEYCTYLYHTELFKDTVEDSCPLELELYYRRQLQRRQKFSREYPAFYTYMEASCSTEDAAWFTRMPEDPGSCAFDRELTIYYAIGKYEDFVKGELERLGC